MLTKFFSASCCHIGRFADLGALIAPLPLPVNSEIAGVLPVVARCEARPSPRHLT